MRRRKLTIFAALAVATFVATARSQSPNPVTWRIASRAHAGQLTTFTVATSIEAGWHIYALVEPENGPVKTHFELQGVPDAAISAVAQSKPTSVLEPGQDEPVFAFAHSATFRVSVKSRSFPGRGTLTVAYQACSESMCLPLRQAFLDLATP